MGGEKLMTEDPRYLFDSPIPESPSGLELVPFESAADVISTYKPEILSIKMAAEGLVVDTDEAFKVAGTMEQGCKRLIKAIDAKRDTYTKDAEEYVKNLKTFSKSFTEDLKKTVDILRGKMEQRLAFVRIENLKAEAAAKKVQEELQAKINAEALKLNVEAPTVPDIKMPDRQGPIRTDAGVTISEVRTWKYELLDIAQVEDKWLIPRTLDRPAVQKAIDGGLREIKGLRIYEHIGVRTR